jgi:hypothetical protein
MLRKAVVVILLALTIGTIPLRAAQDLYIRDTPLDTGIEPDPDPNWMFLSDDIWVRTSPDPGYQPYAFPQGSPPWTPLPHENPEFRDPKYSVPNYVYVRVRNRGNTPSTGTERLRVYWTKASTGAGWPAQWVDYLANNCGPTKLFGAEITKPRKNGATATVAERNAYVNAILSAGTNPAFVFSGPAPNTYWHKQDYVHANGPVYRHGTGAFLPWHREFVNRYEALLQEVDPTVKLLYWDWTTAPTAGLGYMGSYGASGLANIGAPFNPALAPPSIARNLGGHSCCPTPTSALDTTVLGNSPFPSFWNFLEGTPHNYSHVYVGGVGGHMSSPGTAAGDPIFFMLHANADRLWAKWQRDPASVLRLDPSLTYGTLGSNVNITTNQGPWDGSSGIGPWTVAGGYIVAKNSKDPSIVSPPIYDNAPLTIPVLQPNEAAVIQIPWYPPNPADFSCFQDQGHFCLVARLETSTAPPFGMTTAETSDINANTRNNNNIAWKNITVVDNFPGKAKLASVLIHNPFAQAVPVRLRFLETRPAGGTTYLAYGRLFVDLKPELYDRWKTSGFPGEGIEPTGSGFEILQPGAVLQGLRLEVGETYSVDLRFELAQDYPLNPGPFPQWDMIQTGTPADPDATVGGERFQLDLSKLVLVRKGDAWRYRDDGGLPATDWADPDYDDSSWPTGKAELGYGGNPVTVLESTATAYFRHAFEVDDPGFFRRLLLRLQRDDGAIVYLNGREIYRVNLPAGSVTVDTNATKDVAGLEEEVFFPVNLSPSLLRAGKNVLAAEVHQALQGTGLGFDLELSANQADGSGSPPDIAFAAPPDGALFEPGQTVPVTLEAIDPDGAVGSVSLYVDGKLVGTAAAPPFTFSWTAGEIGPHRFRAVARDSRQLESTAFRTVSTVANVPPTAVLAEPVEAASFKVGDPIPLAAQASDLSGQVARVEFWAWEMSSFMAPKQLLAQDSSAPYRTSARLTAPGHYMLWAVAVDAQGGTSQSLPVHVHVAP